MGGYAPGFNETNDQTRKDLTKAELIAFPILALLLLFVFRGVVAAAIPLLLGVISIVGTLLVLRVMSSFADTSLFALNIATGLSLGLAVDYALLMVSRYREEIGRGGATREAHRRTVQTAGRTAVFSGLTVAAAMAALIVMPQRFLYSMAVAGASVGAALGADGDPRRPLAARPARHPHRRALDPPRPRRLRHLRRLVPARPRRHAPPGRGRPRQLGAAAGRRRAAAVDDADRPQRRSGAARPALLRRLPLPRGPLPARRHRGGHGDRRRRAPGRPSSPPSSAGSKRSTASSAAPPSRAASGDVAYANFALAGPALGGDSQDSVHAIRDLGPPTGTAALVSGNTAGFIDQKQSLIDHAPLVVAIVALTTLILLFLLTGSVLLPLKTLLMNTLTLGATLGILVLAFQEGWLDGPLDYTGPAAIEVTSLVFLFAVIFGLATDYAVLVMARIKEQLRPRRQQRGGGRDRDRPHRPRDHRRGAGDRRRLPRLRRQLRLLRQADRDRDGGRRDDRRHHRPRPPRPLPDAPARRVELVGARPPCAASSSVSASPRPDFSQSHWAERRRARRLRRVARSVPHV